MNKNELTKWLTQLLKPLDPEGKWRVELKSTRKRSLNANAYYWVLVGKIAAEMGEEQDEIHAGLLRSYGQTAVDKDGNPIVFQVQNGIDFTAAYRYVDTVMVGQRFTEYRALKGSSELDRDEMRILINGTVEEAKNLGIETLTPKQLFELIERWDNGKQANVQQKDSAK